MIEWVALVFLDIDNCIVYVTGAGSYLLEEGVTKCNKINAVLYMSGSGVNS